MEKLAPASYHFRVDFKNSSFRPENDFMSVSGLDAQLVFEDVLSENPQGAIFGNIVLRRPLKIPSKLATSVLRTINLRRQDPQKFTITLLDSNHKELVTWFVTGGQPVRYALDDFDATKSAIATETFEFRCKGIDLTPPKDWKK